MPKFRFLDLNEYENVKIMSWLIHLHFYVWLRTRWFSRNLSRDHTQVKGHRKCFHHYVDITLILTEDRILVEKPLCHFLFWFDWSFVNRYKYKLADYIERRASERKWFRKKSVCWEERLWSYNSKGNSNTFLDMTWTLL